MEMRKLLGDAFRICLPPVIFGNKYQEVRNYTRYGRNKKNTILHCFGRDHLEDVVVDGIIKFKVILQAYCVALRSGFLWRKLGYIDWVLLTRY